MEREPRIMRAKPFPTQEIGSMPKFSWRTKPFMKIRLGREDIESAVKWGKKIGLDNREMNELLQILKKDSGFTEGEKKRIVEFSLLYALRMQETAGREGSEKEERGLDLVWSGEQARTEMYQTPVSHIDGFEFIGRVRSFDNKYWRIASVVRPLKYAHNYHIEEFLFTKKHAKRRLKIPVTDPITIMAWSDNSYYVRRWEEKKMSGRAKKITPSKMNFYARRDFVFDLATVIRRVVRELADAGAEEIQMDIPAATQYQEVEDVKLVVEAFNETTKGINTNFSVHSCYPPRYGYGLLFPYILEMKNCKRFSFEYANRDLSGTGVSKESRPGYSDLRLFREYGYKGELGVGVIHVHTDELPSLETVRDRILYSAKVTDMAPEKLYINPDCGLRTRSPELAYSMLGMVVEGARLARSSLR